MKKKLFFIIMFFIGIHISFKYIKKYDNREIQELIINSNYSNNNIVENISIFLEKSLKKDNIKKLSKEEEPVIYIYNTHQGEEYASNSILQFAPNVTMVDYILEKEFNKNGYKTLVEERSIKDILNTNNWNYSYSYKASRIYMEDAYSNNNSLKYFIDVHRDSLNKDRTTISINEKTYASLLFLIGGENEKYEENYAFAEKIHNKVNEKYPNLSKGILKKSGFGVNGIYNQDFSNKAILIEVGGQDNNTYEVLNTALAFAECYLEVLNENQA